MSRSFHFLVTSESKNKNNIEKNNVTVYDVSCEVTKCSRRKV